MFSVSEIGNVLAQLRSNSGETLDEVAESVGVTYVSMSRYENGKRMPKMDILSRIADHYGVSLDSILGRNDQPAPPDESAKKAPADTDGLDEELIRALMDLTPSEAARVRDFVAGLKASRGA